MKEKRERERERERQRERERKIDLTLELVPSGTGLFPHLGEAVFPTDSPPEVEKDTLP